MSVAQTTDFNIDPNTTNGTQLADILNRLHGAGLTAHSGAARPAYAQPGTIWLDSSAVPILKWFDGTADHELVAQGGATPLSVASATAAGHAVNLGQADGRYVNVAGDTMTGGLTATKVTVSAAQGAAAGDLTRKDYVDAQVATRITQATADGRYVNLTGDVMTGGLVMAGGGIVLQRAGTTDMSHNLNLYSSWGGGITGSLIANHNTALSGLELILNVGGGSSGSQGIFTFRNNGVGYANNSWQTGSDRRLKTDITRIADALDKLQSLGGYTFKRTDLGDRKMGGVIAQEVQAVLPEGVSEMGGEDNYLAVDPMPLIGLLVEAVKELAAKVDALS